MLGSRFVIGAVLSLILALPLSGAATQGDRFYVLGEVRAPGAYTLPSGKPTVDDGLTLAGGPTARGNADDVIVIRRVDGKETRTPAKRTDTLLPNDTLVVRPAK